MIELTVEDIGYKIMAPTKSTLGEGHIKVCVLTIYVAVLEWSLPLKLPLSNEFINIKVQTSCIWEYYIKNISIIQCDQEN